MTPDPAWPFPWPEATTGPAARIKDHMREAHLTQCMFCRGGEARWKNAHGQACDDCAAKISGSRGPAGNVRNWAWIRIQPS